MPDFFCGPEPDRNPELEQLLESSGECVSVSRDLRPLVIESAMLDQQADVRRQRVTMFLSVFVLVATCGWWWQPPAWLPSNFLPAIVCLDGMSISSAETDEPGLHSHDARIDQLADTVNKDHPEWGLVKVFCGIHAQRSAVFSISR